MHYTQSKLIIISGERNVGKSSLCTEIVKAGKKAGLIVVGILSPTVVEDKIRIRIDAQDVQSGVRKPLAYAEAFAEEGPVTEHWHFDNQTLAWGNDILSKAAPCDILIIDEIGPLELKAGKGWVNGIALLDKPNYRYAFVVIRPELLEQVSNRWKVDAVINLTERNRVWKTFVWRLRVSLLPYISWL